MTNKRKTGKPLPAHEREKYIRDLIAVGHFRIPNVGDTYLEATWKDSPQAVLITSNPINLEAQIVGTSAIVWVDFEGILTNFNTKVPERVVCRVYWNSSKWEINPFEHEVQQEVRILRAERSE